MQNLPKLIVVLGPTASGKSELAVLLAKKFNGEVISADSRQVYTGMDLGSGKINGKLNTKGQYVYKGITHYGIDIAHPKKQFSVSDFQKYGKKIIKQIYAHHKIPIICGGTGFWIDALVKDYALPKVKPNQKLRRDLEKLSTEELFLKLKKLDPDRAKDIDSKNPRRLIRALEIVLQTKKAIPKLSSNIVYDCIWLGIKTEQQKLNTKITKRLKERLGQGLVKEVNNLHSLGLSWKKLESFGLEYKYASLFLEKKISEDTMFEMLLTEIIKYSKRQLTWFKRNKHIVWVKNLQEATKAIKKATLIS